MYRDANNLQKEAGPVTRCWEGSGGYVKRESAAGDAPKQRSYSEPQRYSTARPTPQQAPPPQKSLTIKSGM